MAAMEWKSNIYLLDEHRKKRNDLLTTTRNTIIVRTDMDRLSLPYYSEGSWPESSSRSSGRERFRKDDVELSLSSPPPT